MRIIALSDIHGNSGIINCFGCDLAKADLILIAGDITNFGNQHDAASIIDAIKKYNQNIFAVHGNCDPHGIATYLEKQDICVDGKCKIQNGINIIGAGGVSTGIDGGFFTQKLEGALENANTDLPLVIVTHQPAYGTLIDQPNYGSHAGSNSLRIFIEEHKPILAISGHIHEAKGIDKIGETTLINPGPCNLGFYAIIDIDDEAKTISDVQLKR